MKKGYVVLYTIVTISLSQSMKNGVINEKMECLMKNGVLNEKME